jgi:uncharacterized membrane protein YgcG
MRTRLLAALLLLLSAAGLWALDVPPLRAPVTDLAGMLTSEQVEQLNGLLSEFETATTNQFAVLIIPSLEGEDLESYSIRVATAWALGTEEKDNGLLLLVAKEERRLRIEVGYGLEGVLTDAYCGRVIDNTIVPYFRDGQFYKGITAGLVELIRQTGDEFSPDPGLEPPAPEARLDRRIEALMFLFVPMVMVVIVSILLARSRIFRRLYKKRYAGLKGEEIHALGMEPKLYKVWTKRIERQLQGRNVLFFFGLVPVLPSLAVIPETKIALAVPGLFLFAVLVAPLIFRPRELPYALSYRKVADEYGKLRELMAEVNTEKERREMLKLFFAGYISAALMRKVIEKKGHFDSQTFRSSYASSSSSGSHSSFSGGGGSFGGGGASGSW